MKRNRITERIPIIFSLHRKDYKDKEPSRLLHFKKKCHIVMCSFPPSVNSLPTYPFFITQYVKIEA